MSLYRSNAFLTGNLEVFPEFGGYRGGPEVDDWIGDRPAGPCFGPVRPSLVRMDTLRRLEAQGYGVRVWLLVDVVGLLNELLDKRDTYEDAVEPRDRSGRWRR